MPATQKPIAIPIAIPIPTKAFYWRLTADGRQLIPQKPIAIAIASKAFSWRPATYPAKADCDCDPDSDGDRDQSLLLATDDRQPIPQKPIPIPTGNRELKNKEPRGLPGLH